LAIESVAFKPKSIQFAFKWLQTAVYTQIQIVFDFRFLVACIFWARGAMQCTYVGTFICLELWVFEYLNNSCMTMHKSLGHVAKETVELSWVKSSIAFNFMQNLLSQAKCDMWLHKRPDPNQHTAAINNLQISAMFVTAGLSAIVHLSVEKCQKEFPHTLFLSNSCMKYYFKHLRLSTVEKYNST